MKAVGRWLAEHWITIGSPIVLLYLWEWASATGLLRTAFFPRPSTIAVHLRDLVVDGTLWGHLATTLVRVGWSFSLAAVLGVAIGLAMGVWRRLREGLDPVFAVVYPIPSVLFLPLVSFLVPPGEIAVIVTAAVTSFFLIVVVALEIVSASRGLGALLWLSWQVLKVEDMYATFFVIALLGALLSYGLAALRARLLPWVPDVGDR